MSGSRSQMSRPLKRCREISRLGEGEGEVSRMKRCTKLNNNNRRKEKKFGDKLESDWFAKSGFSLPSMGGGEEAGRELYVRIGTKLFGDGRKLLSNCKSNWYIVPPSHLEIGTKPPDPKRSVIETKQPPSPALEEMPSDILLRSVSVALLPRIYVLGGGFLDCPSKRVYSYDITSPQKGWERRPNMIGGRTQPSAVALDGKIYVFGGLKSTHSNFNEPPLPYAEVYDPVYDKWYLLDSPPGDVSMDAEVNPGHVLLMDRYNNKHLLVRSSCTFFTYDVSAHSFTLRQRAPCIRGRGAVVDGILYTYNIDSDHIIAYDLRKDQWFDEPVQGLVKGTVIPYSYSNIPFLFHIGNGRLCIVHGYPVLSADYVYRNIIVTCSVVRVSRRTSLSDNGEDTLVASLESFKRYVLPGHQLQDCLFL